MAKKRKKKKHARTKTPAKETAAGTEDAGKEGEAEAGVAAEPPGRKAGKKDDAALGSAPVTTSASGEVEPEVRRWPDVVAWSLFGLLVLFFLVLKSFSLHWQSGDENIYFYMAWATVDHGALPYGDYFFAHPVLHLVPGIVLFALFGFGPVTARLVPVGATLTGAVFLFLLARKHLGRVGAVAAVFLYLTAFSLLRASTHWTGINLSVMWIVVGLWAFYGRRPLLSGACMALGVCTGNYVLPAAVMVGLLAVLRARRDGLRYLVGFAVPWLLVHVVCLFLGGKGFIDAVYRYHVAKPVKEGMGRDMTVRVFTENFLLFIGVLLGPLLAWLGPRLGIEEQPGRAGQGPAEGSGKREKKRAPEPHGGVEALWLELRQRLLGAGPAGLARVGGLWAVGYLLFIFMLARVFPFYFLLMFPPMALAGGYAADRLIHHLVRLVRTRRQRDRVFRRRAWLAGAVLAGVVAASLVRVPVQRALLPNYVRKVDKPMKWSDAPLPGFVNGLLRWCCFEDTARAYQDYGTVTEVLFHESRYFEKAEALADWVRANTEPEETIFGDSSVTGIVALLADRRLVEDFADTNTMRFASGITPVDEAIERIDKPELACVVASGTWRRDRKGKPRVRFRRFASLRGFREWLEQNFVPRHREHDRTKGTFFLLGRKPPRRPPGKPMHDSPVMPPSP